MWRRGCYCGQLRAEAEGPRGAASVEMEGDEAESGSEAESDGGDSAVNGNGGSRGGVHVGMCTCHFCILGGS